MDIHVASTFLVLWINGSKKKNSQGWGNICQNPHEKLSVVICVINSSSDKVETDPGQANQLRLMKPCFK